MNLTSFQYFIRVAELKSFTKAADELYISQQSVSMHIKRLEEEYHVQLFERRPSLKLTPAGETFLLFAKDIVNADHTLMDQLASYNNEFFGTITIGLPVNRAGAFARRFVPPFTQRFPHMKISLYEKHSTVLLDAVQRNEVDFALVFTGFDSLNIDPAIYCHRALGPEQLYAVISDTLLQKYFPDDSEERKARWRSGIALEDIHALPLFIRPSTSSVHRHIVEVMRAKGMEPNILIQTASTISMMPLCVQGYGVMFCAPMILQSLREDYAVHLDTINAFPVKKMEAAHYTFLVWHKNKYLSAPIRESMGYIEEMFRQK